MGTIPISCSFYIIFFNKKTPFSDLGVARQLDFNIIVSGAVRHHRIMSNIVLHKELTIKVPDFSTSVDS